MTTTFSLPIRVYYEDTDTGGVVYHSNYLNFMERARSEWLRALGFEQDEIRGNEGVIFAVRAVDISYDRPARFNELLTVTVALGRRGTASLTLRQEVRRDDEVLATAAVRIVCIDAGRFVPAPIPERIVQRVLAWQGETS